MDEPERVVVVRRAEHGPADPRIRDEHEMAQRLDERPLLFDAFVQHRFRQLASPRDGARPQTFDDRPRLAHAVGVGGKQHRALGMAACQLLLDEVRDLHAVHGESVDEAGDLGIDEQCTDDPGALQVHVPKARAGEVGAGEPRAPQVVGVGELHRAMFAVA